MSLWVIWGIGDHRTSGARIETILNYYDSSIIGKLPVEIQIIYVT